MARGSTYGVYQPRSRRAQLVDALEEARTQFLRFLERLAFRSIGALLLLASLVGFASLLTYDPSDASLNNATSSEPSNLLGGFGATASRKPPMKTSWRDTTRTKSPTTMTISSR